MDKPRITILLGTARSERRSEKVAQYLFKKIKDNEDIEVRLTDVKDYVTTATIPPWENNPISEPWRRIVQDTDAFILVFPEYNHSFPGELKIVLDFELDKYMNKPVFMTGVSKSNFGGARAVESLLPVLAELGLRIVPFPLYFPNVADLFEKNESEIDEIYKEKIEKSLNKLIEAIDK